MATIEHDRTSGYFRVRFQFGGTNYRRSLKTRCEKDARIQLGRIEDTLRLLRVGRIALPDGADAGDFILRGGVVPQKPQGALVRTLGDLFERYQRESLTGALAQSSRLTEQSHMGYILRLMQSRTEIGAITLEMVQRYVDRRSESVRAYTIQKELGTLSKIWNWAYVRGYVKCSPAYRNNLLEFVKEPAKEPFRRYSEIQ